MIRANDSAGLAVITQLQPIAVLFTIPQDSIPRVMGKVSAGTPLVVEAYDRDFKIKLATGTLAALDNQVDPASGMLRLKASFPNQDNALFPNQFVNIKLLIDTLRDATIVPTAAIQRGPQSTFAYVLKPDNTVEMRPITEGPTEAGQTVVTRGLAPGETVITDGVDKLQDGAKVAPRSPATQPTTMPHRSRNHRENPNDETRMTNQTRMTK
jgi:multidrug efflux system membrane fusion protein